MEKKIEEVLSYTVRVRGIFGRNRKAKDEFFSDVREVPADKPLTDDEMIALLDAQIVEHRVKPGGIVEISEHASTLEREFNDDGSLRVAWRKTSIRLGVAPRRIRKVVP